MNKRTDLTEVCPDATDKALSMADFLAQHRSLKCFYLLVGANTAFAQCTFGGGMFPLYLKELGLSTQRIGALMGMIPFMQVLSLIATPLVERLGYRRSYLLFYGSRKLTMMAMILSPWILALWGSEALFGFVVGCILLFGVQRALGETAFYPWIKEVLPQQMLGRAQGVANFCGTLAAGLGLALAGWLVNHGQQLGLGHWGGFQLGYLFFVIIGMMGIAAAMRFKGGHAIKRHADQPSFFTRLRLAVHDRRFLTFLIGAGVLQGSNTLFGTFMSLYARDVIGIPIGTIMQLNIASMAGGAASGYFWGHAADRYGSRIILLIVVSMLAVMPLAWLFLPSLPTDAMIPATVLAYFLFGATFFGAMTASMHLMYNTVVPETRKGEYLAIRYAVVGIIAGSLPTLAGQSVGLFEELDGSWHGLPLTSFTPLFIAWAVIMAVTARLFGSIREA